MQEKIDFSIKLPKWLEDLIISLFLTDSSGGVKLSDWSTEDQKRMSNGEMPSGVPEHTDV